MVQNIQSLLIQNKETVIQTVELWRWRIDSNSGWNYQIDNCRYGSSSDTGYTTIDNECADNHNVIVR